MISILTLLWRALTKTLLRAKVKRQKKKKKFLKVGIKAEEIQVHGQFKSVSVLLFVKLVFFLTDLKDNKIVIIRGKL